MLQFTTVQRLSGTKLYIPYAMRAVLGLHEGRPMWMTWAPASGRAELRNQILLTSIPHSRRMDIWSLKVAFVDKPGILARLTGLLQSQNIDIIDCKAATRSQQKELAVHLTIDAQFYESTFDLNSTVRRQRPQVWLKELYTRIICEFIEDLIFRRDGKPNIYIKRNELLADSLGGNTNRFNGRLDQGWFALPRSVVGGIATCFNEFYPSIQGAGTKGPRPLISLTVDSEFLMILGTVFYPNTGHLHVRISAKESVGTLARITNLLFRAGFNVLQTYCRPYSTEYSSTDFLLHLPPDRDEKRDDRHLRNFVKRILRQSDLKGLNCVATFPKLMSRSEIERDRNSMTRGVKKWPRISGR